MDNKNGVGDGQKQEWNPTVKNFKDMFTRFDRIHKRDGQTETDRQTDIVRQHRPRLCIASRSKNYLRFLVVSRFQYITSKVN